MSKIYIVGIGPGYYEEMTIRAARVLSSCDVIVGYQVYVELVKEHFADKKFLTTPMKKEVERCRLAFEEAVKGQNVAMISSGDAGIYGMAGLMYEIAALDGYEVEIEVVPGVTAATSGAAVLGAPLIHDFAIISLSDLLTPFEKIESRLSHAAQADLGIVLYNPSSHKRADYLKKACQILLTYLPGDRVCGYVENIGREGTKFELCTLEELQNRQVNMFTTVFIGNAQTQIMNGKMVTPRGYRKDDES